MSENVTIFDSISEHYADLEPKHWPCDKNVLVKCEKKLSQFNSWEKNILDFALKNIGFKNLHLIGERQPKYSTE